MAHFQPTTSTFPVVASDFSHREGTCFYCSSESAAGIREAISGLPLEAVHTIGTGDYHYISLFWLERVPEPFELILFDNHPDDQPAAFGGGMLSCGSWVADARALPFCLSDKWIRRPEDMMENPCRDLPAYLSIDLDVLSPEFARTGWDQGTMSRDELCDAIAHIRATRRIIGADICGGITESRGGSEADQTLNASTVSAIMAALGIFRE